MPRLFLGEFVQAEASLALDHHGHDEIVYPEIRRFARPCRRKHFHVTPTPDASGPDQQFVDNGGDVAVIRGWQHPQFRLGFWPQPPNQRQRCPQTGGLPNKKRTVKQVEIMPPGQHVLAHKQHLGEAIRPWRGIRWEQSFTANEMQPAVRQVPPVISLPVLERRLLAKPVTIDDRHEPVMTVRGHVFQLAVCRDALDIGAPVFVPKRRTLRLLKPSKPVLVDAIVAFESLRSLAALFTDLVLQPPELGLQSLKL